ncbi:AzlD domain-containing protein [Lactobacillus sp. LC28-10]|uniref:AzlD domain-containing protein n=1 Tax=Secundilactobacillus angelensis TaxID=2722706 RepID=A0ABX1KXI4_9LACO|nr:AzlD domain-containing protein [Secundilactobacillus angelensis]MCH5461640.1 AzlD domain-containing protein [Secundilactobacillus angelensis]NLR17935.1 AzlD domain-containing protein [Secundilactobacillus angelensis]
MTAVNHWNTAQHLLLIILGFFVAFAPRYLPIKIFTQRKIPEWFNEWMKYIPVSLFTALVVKDVFVSPTYQFDIIHHVPEIIASVIVGLIAYFTRSMALSVVVGLVSVFLLAVVL